MNEAGTVLSVLAHYQILEQNAAVFDTSLMVRCPLHADDKASMQVFLDQGRYYCFGCLAHGDIADLVNEIEGFHDKIRAYKKILRIRKGIPPEQIKLKIEAQVLDPKTARLQAKDFFLSLEKPAWDVITSHYLIKRGFSPETCAHFDVRINQSSDYPVIVPVRQNGVFKGYMTRALDDRADKYRFNKGFRKKECVFGQVRPGPVMIVEGGLDMMKAWQNLETLNEHGISVVSTQGWAASLNQLDIILEHATALISGHDNDVKGLEGYQHLKSNVSVPVVRWPFPNWYKDHGELPIWEFEAGLWNVKRWLGLDVRTARHR